MPFIPGPHVEKLCSRREASFCGFYATVQVDDTVVEKGELGKAFPRYRTLRQYSWAPFRREGCFICGLGGPPMNRDYRECGSSS